MRALFNECADPDPDSSFDYTPDDLGLKKLRSGKKIKFMRGYSDDGELIFDPFDPKADKESQPINYNKRFSKEMKQHHKLFRQQQQFVDQLEKLVRLSTGLGTSNPRQLTKTDVELIGTLIQARTSLYNMAGGIGSLKKTIADLQLKQLQKMAASSAATTMDQPVTSDDLRGSAVLSQIINSGIRRDMMGDMGSVGDLPDIDSMDDESLVGVDVRNENRNITLAVLYDTSTSETTPVALNENGEVVDDYNIPSYMNDVDVHLTEKVAKDGYGHTYPLIFRS